MLYPRYPTSGYTNAKESIDMTKLFECAVADCTSGQPRVKKREHEPQESVGEQMRGQVLDPS